MDQRILVVDDDPSCREVVRRALQPQGYEILCAEDGSEALHIVLKSAPPIVVTDWMMPNMDGLELCRTLRSHEGIGYVYIIVTTGIDDEDQLVKAFEAGVDDFLVKPYSPKELVARLRAGQRICRLQDVLDRRTREAHLANARMAVTSRELAEANAKLHRHATVDDLTGLYNRREALHQLGQLWSVTHDSMRPLSCILMDVDHFKKFNDTYGHAGGDHVLRSTAAVLRETARPNEIVCRVGGEEFLVLCKGSPPEDTVRQAERIRQAVEENHIWWTDATLHVSVSVGVAWRTESMQRQDDLLIAADHSMYAAKRSGRNRVCVAGRPAESAVMA